MNEMKSISTKLLSFAFFAFSALFLMSCGISHGSRLYPVYFSCSPEHAHVEIKNKHGKIIFEGETPATVLLKANLKVSPQKYSVTMSKWGYDTQTRVYESRYDRSYTAHSIISFLLPKEDNIECDRLNMDDYFNMCLMPSQAAVKTKKKNATETNH